MSGHNNNKKVNSKTEINVKLPSITHITGNPSIILDDFDFTLDLKVQKKLRSVLPSTNPLDLPTFDVISYVNKLFPTEDSLGSVYDGPLAHKIASIRSEVIKVDSQLSRSVCQAAMNQKKTKQAISETQSSIRELMQKIQSIKDKAIQSERMVEEICSDIRKLDNAKKNLSDSITTLQKLHMLVNGVQQLKKDASLKSYDRASHLILALNDLFAYFETKHKRNYVQSLPQLQALKQDMQNSRIDLSKSIYRDFRKYDPKSVMDVEQMSETLGHACDVIEVLGRKERQKFINKVSATQLQAYGAIYSHNSQKSGLQFLEQRFNCLKKQLVTYNTHYARIFPRYWNVPGSICYEWCRMTRENLDKKLKSLNMAGNMDMQTLVKSLEQCVQFEKELQRLYSVPSFSDDLEIERIHLKNLMNGFTEEEIYSTENLNPKTIAIKHKMKRVKQRIAELENQHQREHAMKSDEQKCKEEYQPLHFSSILSNAFTRYLHYYVELERKSIADVLNNIEMNEKWKIRDVKNDVPSEGRYPGIDDLLVYIKKSIHRCSNIGTGEIFYKIYHEYRHGLQAYLQLLQKHGMEQHLKRVKPQSNGSSSTNKSSFIAPIISANSNLSACQIIELCLIVNTADYLSETLLALEEKLKMCMEDKWRSRINLQDIKEEKADVFISRGVTIIAQGIVNKIGNMLDSKVPQCRSWQTLKTTDDQSLFVPIFKTMLTSDVLIVHRLISFEYHALFNSQICQRVIPRYISAIFKCKKVNEEGGHQLQIDTQLIKAKLLMLPMIGLSVDENDEEVKIEECNNSEIVSCLMNRNRGKSMGNIKIPTSLKNYLHRNFGKVEGLLKTIAAQHSSPDGLATTFSCVVPKGNVSDLMKICELKDIRRAQQQQISIIYNRKIPIAQQNKPLVFMDESQPDIGQLLKNVFNVGIRSINPSISSI